MDTIPTEILHEILSYMPEKDLGSVRLLSHFFNTAANDRYFRTIRVPFTNASIDNLERLSHRPHVARCVKHLIYPYRPDTCSLPSGKGIDKQRRSQDAVPQDVFAIVKFALSKIPNIREITINLDGRELKYGHVFEWPETSLIKNNDVHDFYLIQHDNYDEDLWINSFYELLAGASQAQIRLDKLTINTIWRGILADEVKAVWKHTPLFQNLTSLTVFFCTTGSQFDHECLRDDVREGRIFKFLSSAPKLKKLSLGLDWYEDFSFVEQDVYPISLAKLFGDNFVWKHLESFYFNSGTGSMNAEELMHFWARHSATLKTFGLFNPHLETGTWREVFDYIKEQPKLCLENIVILKPSEDTEGGRGRTYRRNNYRKKINEYVLRGGPPFPPTEAELEEQGLV
ncbi:hypothetical protein RUND412_004956 [Rhizina undulata]